MKTNFLTLYYADTEVGAKLTLDAGDSTKTLKQFRAELKAAQGDALAMADKFGPTSKAALDAAKRVAELRDTIKDANETAQLFDPGAKFQVLGNAVRGVVGGFAALQGAMGLLGVEGEEVQKTLLKVQSSLALLEGLNVVADMTKDWQRLGAVITQTTAFQKINNVTNAAATGIMKALGVSVNTTSTSFKVLKGAIVATGIGALIVLVGEAISYFNDLTSAANDAAEAEKRALEIRAKGAAAQLSGEEEFIDEQEKLDLAKAKAANKSEKEIFEIEQSWQRIRISAIKRFIAEVGAGSSDGFEANKRLKAAENALEINALNFQAEVNRKRIKNLRDTKAEMDTISADLTGVSSGVVQFDNSDAFIDEQLNQEKAEEEAINKRADRITSLRDLSKTVADSIIADQKSQQAAAAETAAIEEESARARIIAAQSTGDALGALADLIGKQTAAGKALAIAQAIINTYVGVTEVLRAKSTLPEPMATIAKIANVATIIATGLSAIKNIAKAQVPGSGTGGANLQAPAPLQPQAPQATQTLLNQQQLNQIGNATVRAFVVESDVSSNQERIRRINRAARL